MESTIFLVLAHLSLQPFFMPQQSKSTLQSLRLPFSFFLRQRISAVFLHIALYAYLSRQPSASRPMNFLPFTSPFICHLNW